MQTTASKLLVDALCDAGVEYVAGVPGGTVGAFATEAALDSRIKTLLVRNEASAATAADVYFRVGGKLMAVMLHGLPGVSNAMPGIAMAFLDSSALVLVVGEVDSNVVGRGAIHDLSRTIDADTAGLLAHVTKRVWRAGSAYQLVEQCMRAVKTARIGRPGPVALTVSENVWIEPASPPGPPRASGFALRNDCLPNAESLAIAARVLSSASRPLIVGGQGVAQAGARKQLVALAEKLGAAVATTTSGKSIIPEAHELAVGVLGWVGNASANNCARQADVVLVVGSRLSDTTTGGWQEGAPFNFGHATLIQIDVDPDALANVVPIDIPLLGDAVEALDALEELVTSPPEQEPWANVIAAEKVAWTSLVRESGSDGREPLQVGRVVAELRSKTRGLGLNLVADIGNNSSWLTQQFEVEDEDVYIVSMGAGTMGLAPSGAIGAALARPDHPTVAWVGDGGLSMTSYALATIGEYRLPVKLIVIDNGGYSSVAKYMKREFGTVAYATFDASSENPEYRLDLAALAEASGLAARQVKTISELVDGMEWALALPGPTLLQVFVDPESYFPVVGGQQSSQLWGHNLSPIAPWVRGRADLDEPIRHAASHS